MADVSPSLAPELGETGGTPAPEPGWLQRQIDHAVVYGEEMRLAKERIRARVTGQPLPDDDEHARLRACLQAFADEVDCLSGCQDVQVQLGDLAQRMWEYADMRMEVSRG